MWDDLLLREWNSDSDIFKSYWHCMYLDVSDSNIPLFRLLVNGYARFSSECKNWILTVPSSMQLQMKSKSMSMCFIRWDTNMFSKSNTVPMLSTCTVKGYLTITPINNKTTRTNSISKHTPMISEYSAPVTDSVTVFWLDGNQSMTTMLIIMMYPVTLSWVSLSPK